MRNWNLKVTETEINPNLVQKPNFAKVLALRQNDFKHYLSLGFEPEKAFEVAGLSEIRLPTLRPSEKIIEMGTEDGSLVVLRYNLYQEYKLYYLAESCKFEEWNSNETLIKSNPFFQFQKTWFAAMHDFSMISLFPLYVHEDYQTQILNELIEYQKTHTLNHRYEWCEVLKLEQGYFDNKKLE